MAEQNHPNDWSRFIAEIVARPGWTKARLVREADLGKNTPKRWIDGDTGDVTSEKVRAVARATGIDYDVVAQVAIGAQRQQKAEDDRAVRMILDSDASDAAKNELIAHIRTKRRESEESVMRDVEFWLRNHRPQPEG